MIMANYIIEQLDFCELAQATEKDDCLDTRSGLVIYLLTDSRNCILVRKISSAVDDM